MMKHVKHFLVPRIIKPQYAANPCVLFNKASTENIVSHLCFSSVQATNFTSEAKDINIGRQKVEGIMLRENVTVQVVLN